MFDTEKFRQAIDYAATLGEEEKRLAQTFLVSEAVLAGVYYVLMAMIVFFLGRRIIQAVIAAYREARAQAF